MYNNVVLLAGIARVRALVDSEIWRDVEVLLDTGDDQSFISNRVEEDFGLRANATRYVQFWYRKSAADNMWNNHVRPVGPRWCKTWVAMRMYSLGNVRLYNLARQMLLISHIEVVCHERNTMALRDPEFFLDVTRYGTYWMFHYRVIRCRPACNLSLWSWDAWFQDGRCCKTKSPKWNMLTRMRELQSTLSWTSMRI